MYLSSVSIENFRCFGEGQEGFEIQFGPALTALVGENDAGKSAIMDALRIALGTTDQEWYRLEDTDFHVGGASREIRIVCKFEGLTDVNKRAFVEYLTYGATVADSPVLYLNWTGKDSGEEYKGRPYRRVEVRSGKDGHGPSIAPEARDLLRATYLRPLRDADQALTAGRGSRLAQVLRHSTQFKSGEDTVDLAKPLNEQHPSLLGISKLVDELMEKHQGVAGARNEIDSLLGKLALSGNQIKSQIRISGSADSDDMRARLLLEKLDLVLNGSGKSGLGSNNLLFIACELLLQTQDGEGGGLVLIEEPEAHLHAQRQLRVMRTLQDEAAARGIQVIITTHSPNLASAIGLNNIVVIHDKCAFSLAEGKTKLEPTDYRFLERFLDVTKANLFFARGVMIVEGDAENILLPTLAHLIDRDFTEHGVSVVNVGGVGLRRYGRIFQRKDAANNGSPPKQFRIPVACVTDMDVMPDCAPVIIRKHDDGSTWPDMSKRKWRAKKDIGDAKDLKAHRDEKVAKASGQCVKTFISDQWTLEYDLALGPQTTGGCFGKGLAEHVFVAACLAENDDKINAKKVLANEIEQEAIIEFAKLKISATARDNCTSEEVLASFIYAKFAKDGVSKAVAAQYLARLLEGKVTDNTLTSTDLRAQLPAYITGAIDYVTGPKLPADTPEK